MITMDVFKQDAFSAMSLTTAIQDLPTVPSFLGDLGIFTPNPIRTKGFMVERQGATLKLIPVTERGSPRPRRTIDRRNVRNFETVRVAESDKIMADALQGIRAFGSETELKAMQTEVAQRQMKLDMDVMLTLENHRLGAINGLVLDADGSSVLYDFYTEFGISRPTEIAFNWASRTGVKSFVAQNVTRPIIRALGGRAFPGMRIMALCGDTFFDAMQENAEFRATYLNNPTAATLREGNAFGQINAWDVTWVNYRGTDDNSTVAIASDKARFIPVGVPNVFQHVMSPAEGFDFVNTLGLPKYSMMANDPSGLNEWVDLHVAAYPAMVCTTPEALLQGRSGS